VRAVTAAHTHVSTTFCIAVDHAALPGHFPGAPIVPGVLLLAECLQRLEVVMGTPLRYQCIDSAKFLKPVAGGTVITATLSMTARGEGTIDLYVAGALAAHLKFTGVVTSGNPTHA
jgi:3-hydroxymyristoyl/3-hydroxydecanoyl-(acyl carrier protein) dehydratase